MKLYSKKLMCRQVILVPLKGFCKLEPIEAETLYTPSGAGRKKEHVWNRKPIQLLNLFHKSDATL
jgi:hypothetical protein